MSYQQGRIQIVYKEYLGGYLEELPSVGATQLVLDSCFDFNESGGEAVLQGSGQLVTYTGYNEDTSTLLLHPSTPISGTVENLEFVAAMPSGYIKYAQVLLQEGEEPVVARVPHALDVLLIEGIRTKDTGFESVSIERDSSEWVIKDIVGEPARIVLDYPVSDGEAPTQAPTVVSRPFAVGMIELEMSKIANVDPYTYEVAGSLTLPVAEDGSDTLVSGVSSTTVRISNISGVALPSGVSAAYFKVRAVDSDGAGPWSTVVSGSTRVVDYDVLSNQVGQDIADANQAAIDAQEAADDAAHR